MLPYNELKRMAIRIAQGLETEQDTEYIKNEATRDEINLLITLADSFSPSWNYERKGGAQ